MQQRVPVPPDQVRDQQRIRQILRHVPVEVEDERPEHQHRKGDAHEQRDPALTGGWRGALGAQGRRTLARPGVTIEALRRSLVLALVALACAPSLAEAQTTTPRSVDRPPAGFTHTAREMVALADRTPEVRQERREGTDLVPGPTYDRRRRLWQVEYYRRGDLQLEVQVLISDRTGRVEEAWAGILARWALARPGSGKFGLKLNAPYVWIPLCLAFLLPFFDPRRPLRLLHLDLLVLLGFGLSHIFFTRGEITTAVPVAYPVLAYLLARMLWIGFRPRRERDRLVPVLPLTVLVVGVIFLFGFRVALNVTDSGVTDVGYAGVIGADRILDGEDLYSGEFPKENQRGDTYGPVTYLSYIPFKLVFGWSGEWDKLPAAHGAAIAFDLLTLLGLFLLGRAMRAGSDGVRLGVALAFAWAAYPYTDYILQSNTNDALVSALLVFALLAVHSSPGRGALMAVAGAAKFVSLALVPLFATATSRPERRLRDLAVYSLTLALVLALILAPFIAQVGLDQFLDRTFRFQFSRFSDFSVWGLEPSLGWLQRVIQVATVGLALLVAFCPRQKDTLQVAALGAAVLIAFEASLTHWFYFYIPWFIPFVLVALFARHETPDTSAPGRDAEVAGARPA